MDRRTGAMKTSEGWQACTGTSLTVGCLLALLTGCDAPGALRAYLGGHERPEIHAESHSSASAAPVPPAVPSGSQAVAPVAPEAHLASSERAAVGAPVRLGRPYEPAPRQENPRSNFVPSISGFPSPGQGGVSTPLVPMPGGVELGKPLPASQARAAQGPSSGARNVAIGGAQVAGGDVSNAARVIAGARASLRACYAREPSPASGAMRFAVSVEPTGASTVVATKSAELSTQLQSCATATVKGLRFAAPETGTATIRFPVTFVSDVPAKGTPVPTPSLPVAPRGTTTL
jgi:hypothetical protein